MKLHQLLREVDYVELEDLSDELDELIAITKKIDDYMEEYGKPLLRRFLATYHQSILVADDLLALGWEDQADQVLDNLPVPKALQDDLQGSAFRSLSWNRTSTNRIPEYITPQEYASDRYIK